jgi:aryl-alcohol dehydrogenase-like predicted oxidoreductase
VESEHVSLGQAFGMGLAPWSPLAYGLLTGKYDRATAEAATPRKSQAGFCSCRVVTSSNAWV